eukprot:2055967-Lingulodinium_polyedra.AAC.1
MQQLGFDTTTVEEFAAAWRAAGIATVAQTAQFVRGRANAIDAWPAAAQADLGMVCGQRQYH